MTAERFALVTRLLIPVVASMICIIAGVIQRNLALVGLGAGGLGIPYLATDAVKP